MPPDSDRRSMGSRPPRAGPRRLAIPDGSSRRVLVRPPKEAQQHDDRADRDHEPRPTLAQVDRRLAGLEQRLEEPSGTGECSERDPRETDADRDEWRIVRP